MSSLDARFPPHTRGWTWVSCAIFPRFPVSPAHAGMDRGKVRKRRMEHRFPPHTRGWTLDRLEVLWKEAVSPAHAGMDRYSSRLATTWAGFPRTRGDGPQVTGLQAQVDTFPPHTRGWTLLSLPRLRSEGVSPAHAGMDRRAAPIGRFRRGFPRTRGMDPSRPT